MQKLLAIYRIQFIVFFYLFVYTDTDTLLIQNNPSHYTGPYNMNIAVDDSILSNIKTKQETDDEDAGDNSDVATETLMEVFGGFLSNGVDDYDVNDGEDDDDPLVGNDDGVAIKLNFPWYCEENHFLKPPIEDKEEELQESVPLSRRSKKSRRDEYLNGSNGVKWKKVPLSPRNADDLPGFVPSGKGPAKKVSNPLEAWHLLMDIPMLNQIVKATNDVIKAEKKKQPHQKRLLDLTELKAWLGLNYLCGVLRNSRFAGPTEELWTLELGNAIFRATMTYKRFEYLGDCLRYVDKDTDLSPPLEEIAGLWEKLVINCRSFYAPSDYCMIDEHILGMDTTDGNAFDHVLPRQPNNKGIRIITTCDARTSYICNALVATQDEPIDEEVNQLVSDIKGTQRCLCLTERFSSIELMQKLNQCQLQVVGALSESKKDIPPELFCKSNSPQVWYTSYDCSLITGVDTHITPTTFLLTSGLSTRVNAVGLYETIKITNCTAFEQMTCYSTKYSNAKKHKLFLEFFYFMLNVSAFNAWTLYRLSENGSVEIEQRDFQRQLGLYLTQQQLKQRMALNIKLPLPLKLQIAEILGESIESLLSGVSTGFKLGSISAENASIPEGIQLQSREIESRRRCRGCNSQKGSKIKTRCQQCLTPYCMRHMISRCEHCSNYKLHQSKTV